MLRLIAFCCLFVLTTTNSLFAHTIKGTITDNNNEPLPFCNVFIQNTAYAVASNESGNYSLQVPEGIYQVTFQFIGFKKRVVEVNVNASVIELNVQMELEYTELSQVLITASGEDPAYGIIRKAIANRASNLKTIYGFTCDTYIKGLQKLTEAPDKVLGIQLNTVLDVDSNNTGVIYLSESSSTFHYQYPDKSKEIMHASIVSGDAQQFSWNDAASMQMNFYNNLETLEGFSQRGFVSPIADNAMFFYEYKLAGQTNENNFIVYKIEVTPKRKADPAYTGIIYITEDKYQISALQLSLTQENGIEFIDGFTVAQEYFYSDNEHLTLKSNKFDFSFNFFGIKGNGYFHAIYNNYSINPIFAKNFFNGEITFIEENANKKDSLYWSTMRPIQLTNEEQVDYIEKDALAILKEQPAYKDSVDRVFNKFTPADLISGYAFRKSTKKMFFSTNPLPDLVQFNTVEGYVVNPKLRFVKWYDNKNEININSNIRYGFGSERLYANVSATYDYDKTNASYFTLAGGSGIQQFNKNGIPPLVNSFYSLLLEENYLKIYEQYYANLRTGREFINGLYGDVLIGYTERNLLYNLPDAAVWVNTENKTYTSNDYPFSSMDPTLPLQNKFTLGINMKYAIGQKYYSQPNEKFVSSVKYPIIQLNWETAIPNVFNSSVKYHQIKLSVNDNIKLALAGNLTVEAGSGILLTDQQLNIADYIHFSGNETIIQRLSDDAYFLLPYYYAATTNYFISGHAQWHTEGFLFRQLPLFKQLKLEPVFSVNYLHTDAVNHYVEIAAGIEHLFKIIRIDVAYTPYRFDETYPSEQFKVLIGFGF